MKYERLTKRFINSNPYTDIAGNYDILNRLAELEDKIECGELVENKVVTYINMARSDSKTLIDKAIKYDKLKDKIENGTLVELPCKVGDTVWEIIQSPNGNIISKEIISDYWITEDGIVARTGLYTTDRIEIEEFGKTVFLTEEIAKQKLKELEK